MRLIRAAGTHYEIGRSCGAQCAPDIRRKLTELHIPEQYTTVDHRAVLARIEGNIRRLAPDLWEELEGIANGSGLPLPHVLMLNSISSLQRLCSGADAVTGGCTSIGFADTPDGVIIGKANDGGDEVEDDLPHLITFPGGRRAVFFAWPGTVWAWSWANDAGMISNGSSVTSNHINRDGLPGQLVPRLVLEHCATLAESATLLRETPLICEALALTMGDAQGHLAVVEQDVYRQAWREPDEGAVFTTNMWFSEELASDNISDPAWGAYLANSRDRFANLQRLAREVPHDLEGMKRILQDHTQPGAVCQHRDNNAAGQNTYNAFIMLAQQRAVLVTGAKACEAPFQRLDLSAATGDEA